MLLQFVLCWSVSGGVAKSQAISYNRDIRPILSENCFFCHGPDAGKRKGKLRLDIRDEALARKAFIPGKPQESELIRRILASDPEDMMPPPDSNKKLSLAQKELLRAWIAADAKYEGHWAYIKPTSPAIPNGVYAVDFLVQKRLKALGLKVSAEADRRTLARRLYLDLTGLPPKPTEVEAFEHDKSPEAYSRLVDKLLASPHYGERMAIGWLDVVRFADTIGYHSDTARNVWPYRDYVIKSFNVNKPFDLFTREQLAGDLLPGSTQEQKVGSAFNRLLLTTEEGGAQAKDYEARMLTDRVRAVGAVWLGQTIGCAQCHDHKFDPITSRDFYSLGAFFADIKEPIIGHPEDGMLVPDEIQAQEMAKNSAAVEKLEKAYAGPHPELNEKFGKWFAEVSAADAQERRWFAITPSKSESAGGGKIEIKSDQSLLISGTKPDKDTYSLVLTNLPVPVHGFRLEALPDGSLPGKGPGRATNGNFVVTEVVARIERADGKVEPISFKSARASFEQTTLGETNPYRTWSAAATIDADAKGDSFGWAILPEVAKAHQLILETGSPVTLATNDLVHFQVQMNHGHGNHTLGHFRLAVTSNPDALGAPFTTPPPKEIADLLAVTEEKRDQAHKEKLWAEFKKVAPELDGLRKELAAAQKVKADFEASLPRCLVSIVAEKSRTVRILPRGNFLVETGDIVEPAIPQYLKASWVKSKQPPLTRLDLADWLVSTENPLTARVTMNRLWKQFFGVGIAKGLDDFGAQGEPPKNQELLDWLASEFMASRWDLKHMVRLLVSSQTYKQTSTLSSKARALDPYNREFSAQGRWRLEAELVRDNALAVSGLLVPKIGGPSVKPYQPDGYWENLNFPTRTWEMSRGEGQYRRGLYTWWQRTFLQPSLVAFDAPSREECVAERNRSNIPQQALVLLNDPTYVEASRVFAARILKEGGNSSEARIRWAWAQALDRAPRRDELATAETLLTKHLAEYGRDPRAVDEILHVGLAPIPQGCDPAQLAAWTSVARVVFNLHETITRN